MLNIVVPMAGRGSRFANAGYREPKPLIPFGGKPMIRWIVENVTPARPHRFVFLCLAQHLHEYPDIPTTLRQIAPECEIIPVDGVTEGAACTVLLARRFIDGNDPLMIANADQYVALPIDEYLEVLDETRADGLVMTFDANDPKWSYCRLNNDGTVAEVVEKRVVSNEATVGIYNFRHGSDFVAAADAMIARDLRVNGEFYVAPAYNQLIERGAKIVIARTGREYDGMYGLGVPGDLDFFLSTDVFQRGRIDGVPEAGAEDRNNALARHYATFFNTRNLAGVASLLHEDFTLEDPQVRVKGKAECLAYIGKVFQEYPALCFKASTILSDDRRSVIEFELTLGATVYRGADVIDWDDHRMLSLRAYLYATS